MTYKTSCVCLFFVSSVHFGHKSSELKEKQNCREKVRRVALRTVRAHDDHRSPHGKDHYPTARKLPELQDNGGRRGAYRGLRQKDRRGLLLQRRAFGRPHRGRGLPRPLIVYERFARNAFRIRACRSDGKTAACRAQLRMSARARR